MNNNGRPRKDFEEKKSKTIKFRLTEKEYNELVEHAKINCLSLSEIVRKRLFSWY